MKKKALLTGLSSAAVMLTAVGAELPIVTNGTPAVKIVMPETTEYDRYLAMSDADVEKYLKGRFPNADEAQMTKFKTDYKTFREKEAKRAGDDEKLAAEELQTYIEKISGAKLEIVKLKNDEKIPEAPAILLGRELAAKVGLEKEVAKLDKDGILLKVSGNKLVLTGQRARGTLYAAYDFLESLGCRWTMPGEFGELLPSDKNIATNIDKAESPSYPLRWWWCTYGHGKEYPRWTLRNKGNFVRALGDSHVEQTHGLAAPLAWAAKQGKWDSVKVKEMVKKGKDGPDGTRIIEMVEKEYLDLPPEYYATRDGKPVRAIPNMANPKVWDLYAEYYINHFTNVKPFDDYVSISAEDGLTLDDRPESRNLDSNEYDPFGGSFTATDRMWFFHERVINKVLEKLPNRKFGVLVYANNMTPPRVTTVHPNMALIFAPLSISPHFEVGNPKSDSNVAYKKWFESWMAQAKAVGAERYYYDYEPLGFQWNFAMVCPRWAIIGKNYPYFYEQGLQGFSTQGFDDWGASAVDNWLMVRLFWDSKQNYKDVLKDYCERRFGKAAPAMLEYYDILEKRMAEVPELCGNEVWGCHLVLTPEVREKCRAAIAKALAAVQDDPRSLKQVEAAADLQKSTDAFCDGIEIARETGDFGAARKAIEPVWEIKNKRNKIYSHFMQPDHLDEKAWRLYTSGGWSNKYLRWDKKIKGASENLILPRNWKIMLDTDNLAITKKLFDPAVSVADLEEWDSTVSPDVKYKTQSQVSAFFYRTDFEVPKSFANKKVTLYFPSLISRALQIWVNGKPVEFDHGNYKDNIARGPETFWYNYDHQQEYDVTKYLKPGQKNTIAFRVFKSFDHAGSYDRIFLLANPQESVKQAKNTAK